MESDAALLRAFAETGSNKAFRTLVERHLRLVYSAALRRVGGDVHRAEDVCQVVFVELARKAGPLQSHGALAGWLHTTTHFTASNMNRDERRRYERERAAVEIAGDPGVRANLLPVLDDALVRLSEPDRAAVFKRYFQGQSFEEIGRELGVSANGARMRIERALDALSVSLGKVGIRSTAAAVGVALAQQGSIAAPTGLAAAIASTATAASVAGAGGLVFMSTSLIKTAVGAAAIAASAYFFISTGAPAPEPAAPVKVASAEGASVSSPAPQMSAGSPALNPGPLAAPTMTPVQAGTAAPTLSAEELANVGKTGFNRKWEVEELYREANLALNAGGRSFERGQKVFDVVGCALCHHFGGGAGGIGPDLSGVGGKFGPREILESIIEPSANISDLYSTVLITLVDGKKRVGRPSGNTDTATQITLSFSPDPATGTMAWNGPVLSIPNDQIVDTVESGVSPMPPGLINGLTKDEIYDFLAFLISVGNPDDRMFKPAKQDFAGAPVP